LTGRAVAINLGPPRFASLQPREEFVMFDLISGLFIIGFPLLLLPFAWLVGAWMATRHEADLAERALAVAHILVHNRGRMEDAVAGPTPPVMVTGEVTFGVDHFRGFLGQWKNLFGGQVRSYQMVLDRARREALMRLLEQTHSLGYHAVANVRIDFADVSGSALTRRKAADVSVLVSATAYYVRSRT
jgi:uncharacterized protein YbjQ (UPF0145 family)